MKTLLTHILGGSKDAHPPEPDPQQPPSDPRTPATIRAEIDAGRGSLARLASELKGAEESLLRAQHNFDGELKLFALGKTAEPSDLEVRLAANRMDVLRRAYGQLQQTVSMIEGELSGMEAAIAADAEKESLANISTTAESAFTVYAAALDTARQSERSLFDLLFDPEAGLKKRFNGVAESREAERVRHALRFRILELARKFGHQIDPRFETDGLPNLGAEDAYYYDRLFASRGVRRETA